MVPEVLKSGGSAIALVSPVGSSSRAAVEVYCGNLFFMDGNGGESPHSDCSIFNNRKIFWVFELVHKYRHYSIHQGQVPLKNLGK